MNVNRRFGQALENAALLVLLVVVGLRPLIAETFDSSRSSLTSVLEGVEDPLPATTLMIDCVIILGAIGWLAARVIHNDRSYRWCGMEWGAVVVGLAASVSCLFAGNKRLAINGAADWLSCMLLAIVLVQLLRDRWRIRLALGVVLASAGAQAIECFHQVYFVFPETEAMYAQEREAIWSGQGVPLDSEQVELYEARLGAAEATGYLSHSNVAGAHLVMCGLVAATVGASLRRRPAGHRDWAAVMPTLVVGAVLVLAATLTKSRGALLAGGVSAGLYLIRLRFDDACIRHGRAVFRWGWVVAMCLALGVVGYGLVFKSLPGRSLGFRWKYWTASARMVADHTLTGVGSGNFGRHYLQYKTIDSPEEVKNPHHFLVAAATDWGLAGAAGLLTMIFGVSRVVTRRSGMSGRSSDMPAESRACRPPSGRTLWRTVGWGLMLAAGIFIPRVGLLGSDDPNYQYFATMLPLLAWATTFCVLVAVPIRDLESLATGIGFALLGFILQDTINFASLVPGTLTTAFALLSVMVAGRYVDGTLVARHQIPHPLPLVWVGSFILAVFAVGVVAPVLWAGEKLLDARRAAATHAAVLLYDQAGELDPLDSQPLYECARLLRFMSTQPDCEAGVMDRAIERIDAAIQRDPMRLSLYREKSRCHLLLAELSGNSDDGSAAIAAGREAVRLYPNDPTTQEALAGCLTAKGRAEGSVPLLKKAIHHYRRALAIDDGRPRWETIRRLRPAKRQSLLSTVVALEALVEELSPAD